MADEVAATSHDTKVVKCEYCAKPATTHDNDGIPSCTPCVQELTVEGIAQVCHAVIRAYAEIYASDVCTEPWEKCSPELQRSARHGVEYALAHRDMTAERLHEEWMRYKLEHGWTHGYVKDEIKKTHPDLIPFDDLEDYEQRKDALFLAIVRALSTPVT